MDANHNRAWLLGAEDPEMAAIEHLLREAGETVARAMAGGAPVTPASAYRATDADASVDCDGTLYLVECGLTPQFTAAIRSTVTIDHHRPGDTGCGKGPEEFLPASSLGQVLRRLAGFGLTLVESATRGSGFPSTAEPGQVRLTDGSWHLSAGGGWWPIADEIVLTAAADHCLAAAYAGKCPGVHPNALREFREHQLCHPSRASNRGETRTVEQVRESINAALRVVVAAPRIVLGGVEIADCRGPMVADLPEAAMIAQLGYLAGGVPLREGERAKVVIGGCGTGTTPGTEPVEAFLSGWAEGEGLIDLYPTGDPREAAVRGFAGGYVA